MTEMSTDPLRGVTPEPLARPQLIELGEQYRQTKFVGAGMIGPLVKHIAYIGHREVDAMRAADKFTGLWTAEKLRARRLREALQVLIADRATHPLAIERAQAVLEAGDLTTE